jgi:hypothetical protein
MVVHRVPTARGGIFDYGVQALKRLPIFMASLWDATMGDEHIMFLSQTTRHRRVRGSQ